MRQWDRIQLNKDDLFPKSSNFMIGEFHRFENWIQTHVQTHVAYDYHERHFKISFKFYFSIFLKMWSHFQVNLVVFIIKLSLVTLGTQIWL